MHTKQRETKVILERSCFRTFSEHDAVYLLSMVTILANTTNNAASIK